MDYLELIPVPPRDTFNLGLNSPKDDHMVELLGHPVRGGAYRRDGECTPANVRTFTERLVTANVGPFRATGLQPAIHSLREVLGRVRNEMPDLYAILGTAGMHCARFKKIRSRNGSLQIGPGISNHTWGTAIDIKLRGSLDAQGDQRTQRGLLVLSAYFNAAGWYWGAAFPTEDAMHFEASKSLLARWRAAGEI